MFLLLIAKCGTGNLSPMKNIFDFPFVKCSFESIPFRENRYFNMSSMQLKNAIYACTYDVTFM